MPELIHYRIFGNAVTAAMHSINSIVMLSALQNEILLKDPDIRTLASMQSRFLTIWNVAFQIAYAFLALACDVLTVTNKEHLLPKPIKKLRDTFFSTIVLSGSLSIFLFFWPIFLYDRELIFPGFIDKAFSQKSNLVMHLAILPAVVWEFCFQPRDKPRSHWNNFLILVLYFGLYNTHIQLTYNERGIWPYPMLQKMYGTIYYVYFLLATFSTLVGTYFMQWPLYNVIWGQDKKVSKKSN